MSARPTAVDSKKECLYIKSAENMKKKKSMRLPTTKPSATCRDSEYTRYIILYINKKKRRKEEKETISCVLISPGTAPSKK